MHRSRASRSVAVLMTALFAFQLLLAGNGVACMMPNRANPSMARDMGAVASGAMAMDGHATTATPPGVNASTASTPQPMPCDQRMNPAMCQAMGPCITALAAAPMSVNIGPSRTPAAITMVALTPPLPTFPPELPPPRA